MKGKNGLYIYYDKEADKCLYVGEGKLNERIASHYEESYLKNRRGKGSKWVKFFGEHKVKMSIYWMELEVDKNIRRLIEQMLKEKLNPVFDRKG
jgi:predicted GIY-YIG superfamily endonuclease